MRHAQKRFQKRRGQAEILRFVARLDRDNILSETAESLSLTKIPNGWSLPAFEDAIRIAEQRKMKSPEVREKVLELLHQLIVKVFERFDQLVANLNGDWLLYKDLFQNPDHYPIFNQSGVRVWLCFRESLLDVIFAGISRLLDDGQFGRALLTIETLAQHLTGEHRVEMNRRLRGLREKHGPLKIWRHRRGAHNDFNTAAGIDHLPDIPLADIDELMTLINDTCRYFSLHGRGFDQEYVPQTIERYWTPRLVRVLRAGLDGLDEAAKS